MHPLEGITTRADGTAQLETFRLVECRNIHNMQIHRFEWAFGLDWLGLDVESDINTVSIHKDLIHYLKQEKLAFTPSPSILNKALSMMEKNKLVSSADERQLFEQFGKGPWEYVLFPLEDGREELPALFHRSLDGSITPLHLDTSDPKALPRFTSMIHPLVVILHRKLNDIGRDQVDPSLLDHVFRPMQQLMIRWPSWTHNRFMPQPTSPKRKRPGIDVPCPYSSSDSECSSSYTSRSSDDSESWRDPEPVKEVTKHDPRIESWSRQTKTPSDHAASDPVLEQYSMEVSRPTAEVLARLDEAMGLRYERLKLILDSKPSRSDRSSRASKRSRRS
ncbi:hypothetical protein AAF712_002877 [Marasmius tenuissimus]|uniref:Uncharacterized protein n=1 Tax=Marasmius tenuissimus TaxID=585030 RepID=A0ABR3A8W9_9AGAR|nr:hypothetical protein PM082_000460 [Marasmius tenuissimus]